MKKDLGLLATRVIGVLIEKSITTPDQYPLSLNAIVNGCNQKSNRYPVLDLSHDSVAGILADLKRRGLVGEDSYRSRVEKYTQRFCNTEFGELKFSSDEVAVICELMLRGPQTPGELRSRAHRMHPFGKVDEIEQTLKNLQLHAKGPFVTMLLREPGKRESRYAHLLNADVEAVAAEAVDGEKVSDGEEKVSDGEKISASMAGITELQDKISRLEAENLQLKKRLRQLGEVC